METITFDTGVREFRIHGGVLRFNPSDPALLERYLELGARLQQLQQTLMDADAQAQPSLTQLMIRTDRQLKELLSWIFGGENDFSQLLSDVNLLSIGENGQRLIQNLLTALDPIVTEGARRCIAAHTDRALSAAAQRRAEQP